MCVLGVALAESFGVGAHAAQFPIDLNVSDEFATETAALIAATTTLFEQVEAESGERKARPVISAPILATPAVADVEPAPTPTEIDVLKGKGRVNHLTGYEITWYPVDRMLGSVDFMGTWNGNADLVCGYVTWDLSDPAAPVLDEIEATFVDVSALLQDPDADVHGALLDANCAFGSVEINYAYFE